MDGGGQNFKQSSRDLISALHNTVKTCLSLQKHLSNMPRTVFTISVSHHNDNSKTLKNLLPSIGIPSPLHFYLIKCYGITDVLLISPQMHDSELCVITSFSFLLLHFSRSYTSL